MGVNRVAFAFLTLYLCIDKTMKRAHQSQKNNSLSNLFII